VEKIGYIEIKVNGCKGNQELSPENYDIREIIPVLENAEYLLFPGDKKERPIITYQIEHGSVRHILKTSIQYIIGFNAVLGQISQAHNIDFLDLPTAKAIECIQSLAIKSDYTFTISTSMSNSNSVIIDRLSKFQRTEKLWADAELYIYGKITNAGGKDKANIHISNDDFGTVRVETPKSFLEDYDQNILYKSYGIRVKAKQHAETGEFDKSSFKFVELLEYDQSYDENYLSSLRAKAKKSWGNIDTEKWLREIRGSYDA
jgi:hypothetical protein